MNERNFPAQVFSSADFTLEDLSDPTLPLYFFKTYVNDLTDDLSSTKVFYV